VAGGDSLMLSLVRRQNEENLKRLVTGGNRVAVTAAGGDYGGSGCGRNNLSAGSSLSCSRVSIVHPLCNVTSADDGSSPEPQRKQNLNGGGDVGGMNVDDEKSGEKTTNIASPPIAAVRSIAVAVPRQQQQQQQIQQQTQQQQQQQQQRPLAAAAPQPLAPQPLLLCKKTLNVDNEQRRQLQLMQQQRQQQQQPIHQQHQLPLHHQQQQLQLAHQPHQLPVHQKQDQQQQVAAQQYNRRIRGDVLNQQVQPNQQQYLNQQQQQHYTASLLHSIPTNNNNNNNNNHGSEGGEDEAAPPSLTVLV